MRKKNFLRLTALILCALLLAGAFAGCSSGVDYSQAETDSSYPSSGTGSANEAGSPEEVPEPEVSYSDSSKASDDAGSVSGAETAADSDAVADSANVDAQKLIRTVYLNGETRDFDGALSGLNAAVSEYGGYVESSSESGRKPEEYGDSGRSAQVVARIPSEKLDDFLTKAGGLIDIISQSSNVENVTSQYYDYSARKESYEVQLQRLESILTEAATLSDVLALETEIARVRYEIESLETTLRGLDNKISYSTVTIDFYELTEFEQPQSKEQSLGERMSTAFNQSVKSFGEWLKDFVVWCSGNLLALAFIIAAIVLLVLWIKRYNRKHAPEGTQKKPRGIPKPDANGKNKPIEEKPAKGEDPADHTHE